MTSRRLPMADAVRPASHDDLSAMARIHATSGTPGLLADLGERFLRDVYYRGLLDSPDGSSSVIPVAGDVVAFVTWSRNSDRLFSDIFRRRLFRASWLVLVAGIRKPRVLRDFAQSVLTVRRSTVGSDIDAEIVSLEVAPAYQGLGLGLTLLDRATGDLVASGVPAIKARLLDGHTAVSRLYDRLGFMREAPFRLHGRDWILVTWRRGD